MKSDVRLGFPMKSGVRLGFPMKSDFWFFVVRFCRIQELHGSQMKSDARLGFPISGFFRSDFPSSKNCLRIGFPTKLDLCDFIFFKLIIGCFLNFWSVVNLTKKTSDFIKVSILFIFGEKLPATCFGLEKIKLLYKPQKNKTNLE